MENFIKSRTDLLTKVSQIRNYRGPIDTALTFLCTLLHRNSPYRNVFFYDMNINNTRLYIAWIHNG